MICTFQHTGTEWRHILSLYDYGIVEHSFLDCIDRLLNLARKAESKVGVVVNRYAVQADGLKIPWL